MLYQFLLIYFFLYLFIHSIIHSNDHSLLCLSLICSDQFSLLLVLAQRPIPTVRCRGGVAPPPRQIFCQQITNFSISVGNFFTFRIFWNIRRRIGSCGLMESSLVPSMQPSHVNRNYHGDHAHFFRENVGLTSPKKSV